MGKKKSGTYIPPKFQSNQKSSSFVAIYDDMMTSQAWSELNARQKILYIYMVKQFKTKANRPNNEDFECFWFNRALYKNKYKLYTNDKTFRQDRDTLIEKGFITCYDDGAFKHEKTVYKFSNMWQWYGTRFFLLHSKYKPASLIRKDKKSKEHNTEST